MKYSYKNIFLIILILTCLFFLKIEGTLAYMDDTEISSGNSYSAATLDLSLSPTGGFSPNVTPTQPSSRAISVVKDGILGFQYTIQTSNETGTLCDSLNLTASRDGVDIGYTGNLKDFTYNAGEFLAPEDWQFIANLTSNAPALQNQICTFDFIFDGTQIGGVGFSDQEIISNTITTGQWLPKIVINEVYYDPDEEHGGANAEWIELYNAGDNVVNLKDWYFKNDSNSTETINQTYNINPGQFVVVAANASMWNTYWDLIPSNAVKIALGGQKLFYGLKNDGDHIALFDSKDNEIDAMSWGSDTYAFDPSCPDVAKGHSLARSPKGYDTDSPSDFVDNPNPNPGTNPHDVISEGSRETNIDKNTPPDIKEDNKEEGVSNNPDEETQSNEEDSHDEPAIDNREDILEELLESENQDSGEGNDGDGETENSNPAPKPVDAIQAPE